MREYGTGSAGPVRIELATSEIEGGSCRAWADPSQVLTVVAASYPEDTFARFVEPRLHDLEEAHATGGTPSRPPGAGQAGEGELPPAMHGLLARLQAVHGRLYRENRSLMRDPRWVELTCALAEEDRVFFVKSAPSWICLLRGGRAYPAEPVRAEETGARGALGRSESLKLAVTSLPVQPGDTIVLLTAEADVPPDLRAVANLFGQTGDLKRACDGLVNLLGLQSHGASAVALRFLPIESLSRSENRENPLSGLAAEANWGSVPDPSPAIEDVLAGTFAVRSGMDTPDMGKRPEPVRPMVPSGPAVGARLEEPRVPPRVPVALPVDRAEPAPRRRRRFLWPLLLSLVGIGMILLAALPLGGDGQAGGRSLLGRALHRGSGPGAIGSLEVAPTPSARRVLLDGQPAGGSTPLRLESIAAGTHRLGLDLGPSGIWETEVKIQGHGVARVAPRLTGTVEIVSSDPGGEGRVWSQGRAKQPIPATLDSLPVGWNRLFFEDRLRPMWDRMVLVRPGGASRVMIPAPVLTDQALVRVESFAEQEGKGLVDSEGDSVWIDGREVGTSPLETTQPPGFHSVRVGSTRGPSYTEVLDLKSGATRHVLAELGSSPRPSFRHLAPGRVLLRGPLLLSVEIDNAGAGGLLRPTLHLPDLAPAFREVALSSVGEGKDAYLGVVDPQALPRGQSVSYYFTAATPEGQTVWSDLYTIFPDTRWRTRSESAGESERGQVQSDSPAALPPAGSQEPAEGSAPEPPHPEQAAAPIPGTS